MRWPRPTVTALVVIVSFLASVSAVRAQGMPQPAKELNQLAPLLGNWAGSGGFRMVAGQPEVKWTSKSTVKKILGGHFVQDDMELSFDMPGFPPMAFRTIYAWDATRERFRVFATNSMGVVNRSEGYWSGKRLLSVTQGLEQGAVYIDRSVTEAKDAETQEFRVDRSLDGGEPFRFIWGTLKKSEAGFDAATSVVASPVPAQQMEVFAPQLGKWRLTGTVSPMPGMAKMEIGAKQETKAILGGHVHLTSIVGDPMPGSDEVYRGRVLLGFDALNKCYAGLELGSFGEYTDSQVRVHDDKTWTWTGNPSYWGLNQQIRTILTVKENGEVHVKTERTIGASAAETSFEATLTRVK